MSMYQLIDYLFRVIGRIPTRCFSYNERLCIALKRMLIEHAAGVPYKMFYNSMYYDSYIKAFKAVEEHRAMEMINLMYQIPSLIIGLIIASIALFHFEPLLTLLCVFSLIPTILINRIKNRERYAARERCLIIEKTKNYIWGLFLNPISICDMKVRCLFDYFKGKHIETSFDLDNKKDEYVKFELKSNMLINIIRTLGYATCIVLLVYEIYRGKITISIFGAGLTTFTAMQSAFERLIACLGSYENTTQFYDDFVEFLCVPIEKRKLNLSDNINEIELVNVAFCYPGNSTNAIQNINMKLKKGERLAIVGANGAGKSTLVKILCGLIEPSDGFVRINDNINNSIIDITAAFQDFVHYSLTLRENVAISDYKNIDNTDYLRSVLKSSVNDKRFVSIGLDTQLGVRFVGKELSGGEWQRIAIARCIFKDCCIYILDEPTAQIDPLMEAEIFDKFKYLTEGKTSVMVTHRISAAKICDRVIVLEHGEIVEDGTHDELIRKNGIYSEMYRRQAVWYE